MQKTWTRRELLRLALGMGAAGAVVLSGCGGSNGDEDGGTTTRGAMLYVTTNDPRPNQNGVLRYSRAADGSLQFLGGVGTGGTGVNNEGNLAGPHDGDYDLIASPDRRFLFALNSGSDTIAVFRIGDSGELTAVENSPFPSGGKNPVSAAYVNGRLYVANMNSDPARPGGTANYTVHSVAANGALTLLPGLTRNASETPLPLPPFFFANSAGPTVLLPSPDNAILFTTLFYPGQMTTHTIGADGGLTVGAGSPLTQPNEPPAANAAIPDLPIAVNGSFHPDASRRILYVHFTTFSQIGVYNYAADGRLTHVRTVGNGGLGACWSRVTRDGLSLFTINTFNNTLTAYDLTDPLNPVETQTVALPLTGGETPANTNALRLAISPDDRFLYVQTQRLNTDAVQTGNAIHVVRIDGARTLTPLAAARIDPPVLVTSRPQGILAL